MSEETRKLVDGMIKDLQKRGILDSDCNEIKSKVTKLIKVKTTRTENIEEIQERHKKEIEELQRKCKHPKKMHSDWLSEYWAPGHMSDFQVMICRHCGKEINRKAWCQKCGKELTDYKWKELYGCMKYCSKCYKVEKRREEIEQKKFKQKSS